MLASKFIEASFQPPERRNQSRLKVRTSRPEDGVIEPIREA
jgi:hypothetical protein